MELHTLKLSDLRKLSSKIHTEIGKRQESAKRELMRRMEKLAAEHGLKLSDVIVVQKPAAKPKAKPAGSKLPSKYWNPLNPAEGWSGHARRPAWVNNWLANGGKLEELAVKRA